MAIPADVILVFARNLTDQAVDLSEMAVTHPLDEEEAQGRYHSILALAEQFSRDYQAACDTRQGFK